jgi:hypothetical protein
VDVSGGRASPVVLTTVETAAVEGATRGGSWKVVTLEAGMVDSTCCRVSEMSCGVGRAEGELPVKGFSRWMRRRRRHARGEEGRDFLRGVTDIEERKLENNRGEMKTKLVGKLFCGVPVGGQE